MWKKIYEKNSKGAWMILVFFLFLNYISPQNLQDYKKMIEEALAQQGSNRQQSLDIRVERVSGSVEIISMGEETTKLLDNYQYPLEVGDTIKTGYDGEVNIYINNSIIINVARNTEIEITETQGEEGILSLIYGVIVSKVEKIKNKFSFKIKTPTAVCGIRGTQFAVEHNKLSNESVFGVIDEGEIDVYPGEENENNLYKISKNQEIVITPSTKRYKVVTLSKLARHRSKIALIKKKLIYHKNRWKMFTPQERVKFRQMLFHKKVNDNTKKTIKNKNSMYDVKSIQFQNTQYKKRSKDITK